MLSTLADRQHSPPLALSPHKGPVFPVNIAAAAAAAAAAASAADSTGNSNPASPLSLPEHSRPDIYPSLTTENNQLSPTSRGHQELLMPVSKGSIQEQTSPQSSTPSNIPTRQNQVGTVLLHGEYIVSLMIDNKERLCLAQISNTLLKDFSYNEIHNRRVALGITCVQCTPVQLEILRRAGAMPISSRRCGMITKREAERLVKSFLEDTTPPKLPESFAFNVVHSCGWGCSGQFLPSRYNSSRAKCIKCDHCQMFFSPNKFIFHFHRTPDAKYHHPDAANFNSWRRHLRLNYDDPNEDLVHVWEDVKAMFNGGSRKRLVSSGSLSSHKSSSSNKCGSGDSHGSKRARLDANPDTASMIGKMGAGIPYPYPVMPLPSSNPCSNISTTGPYIPRAPHPAFPFPSPDASLFPTAVDPTKVAQTASVQDFWKAKNAGPYMHPINYFWAKNFGLYNDTAAPYRSVLDFSRQSGKHHHHQQQQQQQQQQLLDTTTVVKRHTPSPPEQHPTKEEVDKYFSAFKPVARDNNNKINTSFNEKPCHGDTNWLNRGQSDGSDVSVAGDDIDSMADPDDTDINVTDVEHIDSYDSSENQNRMTEENKSFPDDVESQEESRHAPVEMNSSSEPGCGVVDRHDRGHPACDVIRAAVKQEEAEERAEQDEPNLRRPWADSDRIYNMSREELQDELRRMMEERRRAEEEYKVMSATYNEKMKKSVEERARTEQMSNTKDSVNQEEEAREQYIMQQKIKEARDALQQFSGKLLALRGSIDCN